MFHFYCRQVLESSTTITINNKDYISTSPILTVAAGDRAHYTYSTIGDTPFFIIVKNNGLIIDADVKNLQASETGRLDSGMVSLDNIQPGTVSIQLGCREIGTYIYRRGCNATATLVVTPPYNPET